MKKLLLLFIAFFICFSLVFATDSRISSLGVPAWMVYDDDSLIKLYPGLIADYKNTFAFNSNSSIILDSIGTFDLIFTLMSGGLPDASIINKITIPESGYITLGIDTMTLGIYSFPYRGSLLYNPMQQNLNGLIYSDIQNNPHNILYPNRVYGVLFGIELDTLSIGTSLGIADKSTSFKYKEENSGSYTFDDIANGSMVFNLGIGASMNIFDLGVNLSLPMVDNKGATSYFNDTTDTTTRYLNETLKTDSGFDVEVNARVILSSIIIGGEFTIYTIKLTDIEQEDNSSPYDGDFTDSVDENYKEVFSRNLMQIKGGIAGNLSFASDKLSLIPGLLVKYITIDQINDVYDVNASSTAEESREIKTTIMSVGLNLAAESKITDVLVARVGVSKNLFSNMKLEMAQKISSGTPIDPVPKTIIELAGINSINLSGGISVNIGQATVEATVTGGINVENLPVFDIVNLNLKIPGSLASQISAKYSF
ncbi:MAG: hypothetical protein N2114_05310 [Candidatus Goldbacteria bacterium]|nr:hypothetical protein [Candidatus Goldiibacteriota bacterium]